MPVDEYFPAAGGARASPAPTLPPPLGVSTSEEVPCLKREATENSFEISTRTSSGEQISVSSVGLQTYKRRKLGRSSSGSKGQENGGGSVGAASKLEDETLMEQLDCLPKSHASLNDARHKECRTFILERICRSLNNEEEGIQCCIRDALKREVKGSDTDHKDRENCPLQPLSMCNGTHHAAIVHTVMSNDTSNGTHRPATEMCQHAFRNIIYSDKFTSLCKLLFDNFPEFKTDNILSLSPIHKKMRDGTYEHSPWSFHADIQLMWKKLQDIGNELKSVAEGLSVVSMTCYNEQFRPREAYLNGKSEDFDLSRAYNACTCELCGDKANIRECLVCGSCGEMYHWCCIEPPVKEFPPGIWYCGHCTAGGPDSSHENCTVCARLDAPRAQCTQANNEEVYPANEKTSNQTWGNFQGESNGGSRSAFCRICGGEPTTGDKVMMCEHGECLFKYYHTRCLSKNQLKKYGPLWYCPSCLCQVCCVNKDDGSIVLCDACDNGYHTYCLVPPLSSVPDGNWFCEECDANMKKIQKAKKQYEEQRAKEVNRKCGDLGEGRERMDVLLTAALGHTSNGCSKV